MENWKKTFAVIWSGQLASILSSSVVAFAIIFWVSLETGSAQVLALAAIAGMLPQSLLGPLVGVYVDRWDRKWTMILADSFIALCTLLLAVLFWLGVARMWHISCCWHAVPSGRLSTPPPCRLRCRCSRPSSS